MKPALNAQVQVLTADVLHVPRSRLSEDARLDLIETWDSLAHVSLVVALEQQFNIELDPEDIENMRSIRHIVQILSDKLADGR